jgi:hypothetical protein
MVYCVQGEVRFTSANRRDQFAARAQNVIAARTTWSEVSMVPHPSEPSVAFEVRFTARAEQVDAWTLLLADSQSNAVSWSFTRHDCAHDGTMAACAVELAVSG